MTPLIDVQVYSGLESSDLSKSLEELLPNQDDDATGGDTQRVYEFMMLCGPPTSDTDIVKKIINCIPPDIPVFGASSETCISLGPNSSGENNSPTDWMAVHVKSRFITPHPARAIAPKVIVRIGL
jgi:hypothetical protein